jgi:nicotinamide mononucleotide (NMN) deamidase PncC
MSDIPNYSEFVISDSDSDIISILEEHTKQQAYKLLTLLNGTDIQIATSESLTAGLIMSTLVKIPWCGWNKYGCIGVYDTDAKRVFNSVMIDDVYTHTCAKEMAIGLLNNSNATLALSVTGNAMPYREDALKLGEIFIGIAGYREITPNKYEIIYKTIAINNCIKLDDKIKQIDKVKKVCKEWLIHNKKAFAPRTLTSAVAIIIRTLTAYNALIECQKFIMENKLVVPNFIKEQKKLNEYSSECIHLHIPSEKYPKKSIPIVCIDEPEKCKFSSSTCRVGTAAIPEEFTATTPVVSRSQSVISPSNEEMVAKGGSNKYKKTKKQQNKRTKKQTKTTKRY